MFASIERVRVTHKDNIDNDTLADDQCLLGPAANLQRRCIPDWALVCSRERKPPCPDFANRQPDSIRATNQHGKRTRHGCCTGRKLSRHRFSSLYLRLRVAMGLGAMNPHSGTGIRCVIRIITAQLKSSKFIA